MNKLIFSSLIGALISMLFAAQIFGQTFKISVGGTNQTQTVMTGEDGIYVIINYGNFFKERNYHGAPDAGFVA